MLLLRGNADPINRVNFIIRGKRLKKCTFNADLFIYTIFQEVLILNLFYLKTF